jgi:SAM-dependent methyltransferase
MTRWDTIWERKGNEKGTLDSLNGFNRQGLNQDSKAIVDYVLKQTKLQKNNNKDTKVLEFGCGAGRLSQWFMDYKYDYIAVEKSSSLIERYKENFPPETIRPSKLPLPFEDKSFDLVFTYSVLHYVDDIPLIVEELLRVSRGVIFLGDVESYDHTQNYDKELYRDANHNTIQKEDLVGLLSKMGLTPIFTDDYVYIPTRYNCIIKKT